MSQVSTVYDNLVTLVSTELTDYKQLPNPYELENNSELILKKAFGIGFADGANSERLLSCKLSVARNFEIVLVNLVTSLDHATTARATQEKNLFEDQYSIIDALEKDATVNGAAGKAKYVSDTGLEFIDTGRLKFYLLSTIVEVEYFETLT